MTFIVSVKPNQIELRELKHGQKNGFLKKKPVTPFLLWDLDELTSWCRMHSY